jgi:hypothetical protein
LDILALKEWDRQNSVEKCDELINSLQAFGGIVERSETFWSERVQYSVYGDTAQGTVVGRAMNSQDGGMGVASGDVDLFVAKKYCDPRNMTLPTELIPLCSLYDRHILRQKVIIQLSVPLNARVELCHSGDNTPSKDVDHLYLWSSTRARDDDEEFGRKQELELAVEIDENNVIVDPEESDVERDALGNEEQGFISNGP